ncbi:uncharacterized protein J3D65DRAFT_381962 [Phyllosticta citribraziliensis]|uniref:Uncharacterized protein n=1 Tax=Phyllosticta citribraziliensis TaxID=989973 RepID=A0ABR1LQI8_9PEZI
MHARMLHGTRRDETGQHQIRPDRCGGGWWSTKPDDQVMQKVEHSQTLAAQVVQSPSSFSPFLICLFKTSTSLSHPALACFALAPLFSFFAANIALAFFRPKHMAGCSLAAVPVFRRRPFPFPFFVPGQMGFCFAVVRLLRLSFRYCCTVREHVVTFALALFSTLFFSLLFSPLLSSHRVFLSLVILDTHPSHLALSMAFSSLTLTLTFTQLANHRRLQTPHLPQNRLARPMPTHPPQILRHELAPHQRSDAAQLAQTGGRAARAALEAARAVVGVCVRRAERDVQEDGGDVWSGREERGQGCGDGGGVRGGGGGGQGDGDCVHGFGGAVCEGCVC